MKEIIRAVVGFILVFAPATAMLVWAGGWWFILFPFGVIAFFLGMGLLLMDY